MYFPRTILIAVLALAFGLSGWSKAWGQNSNETAFIAEIQTDAQAIVDFINPTFSQSLGFFSTLGWNTPANVFDIVKGPKVEVGVGVGADVLLRLPNLSTLSLPGLSATSGLNLPTFLPLPFPVATGRVGLVNGLDAGLRVAAIPRIDIPSLGFAADFFGFGFDLRFKIVDEDTLPMVTGGISFDTMKGTVSISTSINQTTDFSSNPATITGTAAYALDWNIQSVGARVQVGKDLGVIFPFCSVGFQRNSGSVASSLTGSLQATLGSPNGSGNPFTVPLTAISSLAPVVFEPKFTLGFDVGEGFHWGVVAESNGVDIAGSTSFRGQF